MDNSQPSSKNKAGNANGVADKVKHFKCATCGKEYVRHGGLGRHYRENPAHNPAKEETVKTIATISGVADKVKNCKCDTCGRESIEHGWLDRHYRHNPSHNPAKEETVKTVATISGSTSLGTSRCNRLRCKTCDYVIQTDKVTGPNGVIHHIKDSFTCESSNIVYAIICLKCPKVYIGETVEMLRKRFGEHRRTMESGHWQQPLREHVRQANHSLTDIKVTGIEQHTAFNRVCREKEIIDQLGTRYPKGLNIRYK